jgi:hypothetical protein
MRVASSGNRLPPTTNMAQDSWEMLQRWQAARECNEEIDDAFASRPVAFHLAFPTPSGVHLSRCFETASMDDTGVTEPVSAYMFSACPPVSRCLQRLIDDPCPARTSVGASEGRWQVAKGGRSASWQMDCPRAIIKSQQAH